MNSLNEFVDYVWSFYGEHDDKEEKDGHIREWWNGQNE